MSWLSHLTGTKSPPQSGRASANKKKKTRDAMDTDEIDEGAFFWVPGEVDQSLLSKPPAYPSSSSSSASSSSFSSSSSSSGRSLFTLPSSSAQLSFSTTSDRYGDLAPAAAAASPAPSTDELPPPYPRGAAAALYPPVATAPSSSRPTSVVGACSTSAAYLRTQAYAPLQHCSFSLNPRLASVQSTPQSRAAVALLGQLKEMEDRLKQGPIYDPCFEAEVVVQAKQDREKQEDRMSSIECRYRKQRELAEAEAKRLQDIAITEWVEQQQRRREGDNQQPVSPGTEEGSLLDGSSLIDLSFSPRPPSRVVDHQSAKQHSDLTELPPPYPGPPLSQQPPPSSNASMPVHFPAPTASSSSSSLFPSGSAVPSTSSPSPAGTAIVHFPATPSQMLGHGSSSAGVLTRHPVYCVAPFAVAPPPLAFPQPPPPRSNIPTPFSAPHGTTLQPAAPNVAVQLPVKLGVPSPFSPPTQTATTSDAARLALVSAPPRVTMEEYQRKYPVLANPERRAIFIQLLEMKFKPEIIAMGLEVFPDNQPEKIVTFVANFHKLAEMGYPSERIKQSLLLHEDGDVQKAIVYLEELDSLLKAGLKESEIFDAFLLFDNDIQKAASFLTAHTALAQFGFDDLRIREALLMCDNNQEKAAQYLMMNT